MRCRGPRDGGRRTTRLTRMAAVVVAATVLAGCASAVALTRAAGPEAVGHELATVARAQSPAGPWQVAWVTPSLELTGVRVFGPQDVWVAASDGRIYAWDGTGWHVQRLDDDLGAMAAVSPRDVWVSSDDGIRHWDGAHWSLTSHDGSVTALAASDARHVWAGDPTGIRTWTGTSWVRQYAAADADVRAIAAPDATHAWAVGSLPDGSGVIVAWNGTRWSVQATTTQPLSAIYAAGPEHAWAVSTEGTIYGWNGRTWSATADVHLPLTAVTGIDATHVWAVAQSGEILALHGATWTVAYRAPTTLTGIAALDPSSVWAIGLDTIYSTVDQGSAPSSWTTSGL